MWGLIEFKNFSGVFVDPQDRLYTKNLVPGQKIYGEELVNFEGAEYRQWDPFRSKLAAALLKGLKEFPIKEGSHVLYLGSAEGTTVGHISDIIGETGIIFGVDISAKAMQKFSHLCESRPNILPILADASQPESYSQYIKNFSIDLLYQDVSQKNQAEIFLRNAKKFLKIDGYGMLCVKAHSIDSTVEAKKTIESEAKKLEQLFEIIQVLSLAPFDKEHGFVLCKKK